MPRCRGKDCGAEIRFVPTASSDGRKFMAIDVNPDPNGNVWIEDADGQERAVVVHRAGPPFGKTLYMAHWKTCKNADDFRRGRD